MILVSILAVFISIFGLLSILYSTIRTGISPMPSSVNSRLEMMKLVPTDPKFCIDLGSGWGGLLLQLSKRFPKTKIIGYEISILPYLYSKWVCRNKNIDIFRKSYLSVSHPEDTVFFCYLCPSSMKKLAQQPPEYGWLISHTFALPSHTPVRSCVCDDVYRTRIYVYDLSVRTH